MVNVVAMESDADASRAIIGALDRGVADPRLYYASDHHRYYAMDYEAGVHRGILKNPDAYAALLRSRDLRPGVPTALVSIGCGDARTDAAVLERLPAPEFDLRFVGIDISAAMLGGAAKRLEASGRPAELLHSPFEDAACGRRIDEATRDARHRTFLFLGNTFSNAEPADIVPVLAGRLRTGDSLLFDVFARTGTGPADDDALGRKYWNDFAAPQERAFLLSALDVLGIPQRTGELRLDVDADDETGALRLAFRFAFTSETHAKFKGHGRTFKPGSSLRLFSFHAYHPERLQAYLERNGFAGTAVLREGREALFLLKRI